jgi:hypothetical protein
VLFSTQTKAPDTHLPMANLVVSRQSPYETHGFSLQDLPQKQRQFLDGGMTTWLQKQRARWSPRFALGTRVTVDGTAGYTVAGYDYAGRRYRVLKVVADPPSRSDVMAGESAVILE